MGGLVVGDFGIGKILHLQLTYLMLLGWVMANCFWWYSLVDWLVLLFFFYISLVVFYRETEGEGIGLASIMRVIY